jgi:circadian clock protein KaiC
MVNDKALKMRKLPTGITGLDEILLGGLLPGSCCMLRGGPGTGKTTIGVQFLAEGAKSGERVLFITLEENEAQIRKTAENLGLDVSGVSFLDLSPSSVFFTEAQSYDIFSTAEVEKEPITQRIVEEVGRIRPKRVFVDPLTQFRYLSADRFQFHRQVLSFLRFLTDSGATVMLTSESSPEAPDSDVQFLVHAVVQLESERGARSLSVIKYRNSDFFPGSHAYRLSERGAVVYPRLDPKKYGRPFETKVLSTGIREIDNLLGGGIESGTVSMISGPPGVGKTTLGMQMAAAGAARGEKTVVFSFEEKPEMILARCDSVNIRARYRADALSVHSIEPVSYMAEQFALLVRNMVEKEGVKLVMLDSARGYGIAMKNENPDAHLYMLCKYLRNMGVTVLLTVELNNITGNFKVTENGISYIADNIVFLRYLEMRGEMKKAIGVLKKRRSDFEKTLREFEITSGGLKIGEPLTKLRGILRGEPQWV